jgi:hypothetical protein
MDQVAESRRSDVTARMRVYCREVAMFGSPAPIGRTQPPIQKYGALPAGAIEEHGLMEAVAFRQQVLSLPEGLQPRADSRSL